MKAMAQGRCFGNNSCYGATDWVASGEIQDPTPLIFGVTAIFGLHTMLLPGVDVWAVGFI